MNEWTSKHTEARREDPKEEMGKYGGCDTAGVGKRETEALKVRSGHESENKGEEKPEPHVALVCS